VGDKTVKTANLSPEARAVLAKIDLHFHDLRREAGSRWLEGGVPLHTVRSWLGHTNIAQTSTYLSGTLTTEHEAMRRFESNSETLGKLGQKPGAKRLQTAGRAPKKPHKTGVGREATIN
jgi:integrase